MRLPAPCLLLLFLLVTLSCSPAVPEPPDDVAGEGEDDEDEPQPCSTSDDCRGGELCDDGVCLEVCSDDNDCDSAVFATCDLERGRCVECVDSGQCASTEACIDQRCVFFCDDNSDCRGGEVCAIDTGACRAAECVDDDGCRGGFLCDNGVCVSILPIVCEANSVSCDGNSVATCNIDGTGFDQVACNDDEACIDGACAAVVCVANDFGCDNDTTAWVCDSSGTQRDLLACRADQYCDDGACRTRVCTPNSVVCAGDSLVVCDAAGATSTVEPCADVEGCADNAFGCSCGTVDGSATCVERVCSPGVGQCVGNGVRICNDSGSGFSSVVDCGTNDCIEGRCLSNTCVANSTVCSGDLLLTCDADGSGYRATTCAETCAGADGSAACVNQVCEPRATRCDAAGENVLACNDRGSVETTNPCVDGFCQDGLCRAEVCTPNRARCTSSTSAAVCDARGASERGVACGAGETCTNGVCADTSCTPQCGARTCGTEATCGTSCGTCDADETCSANGQCITSTTSSHVLQIVTTWTDTATLDFDTYLSRTPGNGMCEIDTCYVGTCLVDNALRPDWDGSGSASDGDPVAAFSAEGEETLTLTLPLTSKTYRLGLHYDSTTSSDPQASVRVRVFLDGVEIDSASKVLRPSDLWDGTTITWNGTRIALVDSTRTQSNFVCDASPGACNDDFECPDTQFCNGNFLFAGVCVDGCRTDDGCAANELCDNNVCVAGLGAGVGDTCSDELDCRNGLTCGLFTGTCFERCESSQCLVPGFLGCCELTRDANGSATCSEFGFCQ
jgi:hypothetical protein